MQLPLQFALLRALAVALCVCLSACGDGAVAVSTDVTADIDAAPDVPTDVAPDPCRGERCSGHGTCVALAEGVTCACAPGFEHGEGMTCVAPGHCSPGFVRAAGECVPAASLPHWCDDKCDSLVLECAADVTRSDACAPYCGAALASRATCVADCLGGLDQPGAAERAVCNGLARRIDSVHCDEMVHCDEPADATPCAGLCDAAQGCGLLMDSALLLGSSRGECMLYCGALARALKPSGRFPSLQRCLAKAMTTCDAVGMLACTTAGVPELYDSLCTTTAKDCNFIPDVWPDSAACDATLASWTPGQRVFVGGCMSIANHSDLCGQNHCASPPATLPAGVRDVALQLMTRCPKLLASPVIYAFGVDYYAWMMVAVLQSFGKPIDRDYAPIAACFAAAPCPVAKAGSLDCLLNTP